MLDYIKTWISLKTDERAVTALEYALIAAAIAGVIVLSAGSVGTSISTKFTSLAGSI